MKAIKLNMFIYALAVKVAKIAELQNLERLQKFVVDLTDAVSMKALGPALTASLPSLEAEFGDAYSVAQILSTSILSVDTWPEHSAFTITLGSCVQIDPEAMKAFVNAVFPGSQILRFGFLDNSFEGLIEEAT